jgi:hypothetical protein
MERQCGVLMNGNHQRRSLFPFGMLVCACVLVLLFSSGCQLTQSTFSRTTSNAAAAFAAAVATLNAVHEGKLTTAYARSSFLNYQSELQGLDQRLSSQSGTSDQRTVSHLLAVYRPAMLVVKQPCLTVSCNWHVQRGILEQAQDAFLQAGEA